LRDRFDDFEDFDMRPRRSNPGRGNSGRGNSGRGNSGRSLNGSGDIYGGRNSRGGRNTYDSRDAFGSRGGYDMGGGRGGRGSMDGRRRKKRRNSLLPVIIPVAVIVILIGLVAYLFASGWVEELGASSDKADLNEYFRVSSADMATVVSNGEVTDEKIKVKDGTCYLDFDTVKEQYSDRFYYDKNDSAILYTNAQGVISAPIGQSSYSLNGSETQTGYVTSFLEGETLYVALDYVRLYSNFSFELYGGNGEPYRINLQKEWGTKVYAKLNKDRPIREAADKGSAIREEINEGTDVQIISSEDEKWMYVMAKDLVSGYIEKKYLDEKYEVTETPVTDVQEVVIPTVADGSSVVLAWHNVTNVESAKYLSDYTSQFGNFNTISPTWFYLSDNEGTVSSIASHDYVTMAHNAGLKVWGLVENMTYADVSTYEVLSYSSKRANVINQLLAYAAEYQLDGINVDFESLSSEAGEPFIQFIRELSLAAHAQGLVVSVDNYVPQGYTEHYHRKEQGVFADYVIIMGYDEHYNGSSESGSVASLGFVMDGIQKTVAEVPANKVINALPFYTRVWTEIPKSEAEIQAGMGQEGFVGYNLEVQTLAAQDAYASAKSNGANITWNEECGQNYAEWTNGGNTVKCWLEDADSIKAKLAVMQANNLAGVAVWQLAYGNDSLWEPIRAAYPAH